MASKSLGTLTLDLVAKTGSFVEGMDKASRKSKKTADEISKFAKTIGIGIVSGVGAATAGLAAMTTTLANSAREIKNLSGVANASTTDFQKIAFAAKRFGIEQEKVSDILKDTNDRVGDFLQTGGGPMADFFEKIGPLVGVTADEFARLSGPEALQLYVSSLEKAGASQQEMTFYMEALAGDATLLLPLLRDNGAELKRLGEEAVKTGNVLSDLDFKELEEITRTTDALSAAFSGVAKQVTLAAVPAINDLADLLSNPNTIESAEKLGNAIVLSVSAATKAILGTVEVVRFLGAELASISGGAAYDDIVRLEQQLEKTKSAISNPTERLRFFGPGGVVEYWDEGELNAEVARLEKAIKIRRDEMALDFASSAKSGNAASVVPAPQPKDVQAWERYNESVKIVADSLAEINVTAQRLETPEIVTEYLAAQEDYAALVLEMRTNEERLNDTLIERIAILEKTGNLTSDTAARVAAAAFENAPEFAGLAPEIGGAGGELRKIDKAQAELEDWYSTQLEMLEGYRQQQSELNAQWDEQELALKKQHEAAMADIEYARQQASLVATEDLFGSLADAARVYAGEQSDIFKVLFAAQKAAAIAQSLVAIQTGIAQAAANPFPANLAAMASVAAATASIIGNIASVTLTGSAHDGIDSVPETGTWMLKKGERVTTAETSAKLDKTLEQAKSGMTGGAGGQTNLRIVNSFDSGEVVGGFLGSKAGERAVMNIVKRNSRTMQSLTV